MPDFGQVTDLGAAYLKTWAKYFNETPMVAMPPKQTTRSGTTTTVLTSKTTTSATNTAAHTTLTIGPNVGFFLLLLAGHLNRVIEIS